MGRRLSAVNVVGLITVVVSTGPHVSAGVVLGVLWCSSPIIETPPHFPAPYSLPKLALLYRNTPD